MIAGWAPDEAFWLTGDVRADGDIIEWARDDINETWSGIRSGVGGRSTRSAADILIISQLVLSANAFACCRVDQDAHERCSSPCAAVTMSVASWKGVAAWLASQSP